jgi:putative glutamine amidotransferase
MMNRTKIIGLSTSGSAKSGSYNVGSQYASSIEAEGAIAVMLPQINDKEKIADLVDLCDGILLTGGVDVSPSLYGEEKIELCGEPSEERDSFELELLRTALAKNKPVLCICRGVQLLNVAMGGSLWQDIPSQLPNSICHRSSEKDPAEHRVRLADSGIREKIEFNSEIFAVNSYHHQAIKVLGEGLESFVRAEGDGMIEGVYMPERKFVVGVQWHPELWTEKDHNARAIFKAFVKAL